MKKGERVTCQVTLVTVPDSSLTGGEAAGRAEGSSAALGLTGVSASLSPLLVGLPVTLLLQVSTF